CAVNSGDVELVRLLLDHGAAVNVAESRGGQTALMWAAADGRSEIARLLIERGANVNTVSKNGYNTLLLSAQQGDINSVKLLLAAKVDPGWRRRSSAGGCQPQARGCEADG